MAGFAAASFRPKLSGEQRYLGIKQAMNHHKTIF
jgi:hypothetical protein